MTPKERPIIFSAEMVRAILEGRKTQTRRPIKPQPPNIKGQQVWPNKDGGWSYWINGSVWQDIKCPFYKRGDVLWVKETWKPFRDKKGFLGIRYKGGAKRLTGHPRGVEFYPDDHRWKSPIYMPHWASRITLEITDIRIERVQDITEKDAIAEGAFEINDNLKQDAAREALAANKTTVGPIDYFRELWDSIYIKMKHQESDMGKFSADNTMYLWDQNPWVWVIKFKKLKNVS